MDDVSNDQVGTGSDPASEMGPKSIDITTDEAIKPERSEAQFAFDEAFAQYVDTPHFGYSYVPEDGRTARSQVPKTNFERLKSSFDSLHSIEPGEDDVTDMTICIPVAILKEDPETVAHTINLLQTSVTSDKKYEVILWANANLEDDQSITQLKYKELIQKIEGHEIPNLLVKTALHFWSGEAVNMSEVRSGYMEAVAMDAHTKGYGYDYPVMWLDADTNSISKGTLENTSAAVRRFDAAFVHPSIRWNADWATDQKVGQLDDSTRAIAIKEIHRRQGAREQNDFDEVGEEDGAGRRQQFQTARITTFSA